MLSAIFSRTLGFLNKFLQFVTFWEFVNFCIFYVVPSINVIYNVDMICSVAKDNKKWLKPSCSAVLSCRGGGSNKAITGILNTGGI